MYNTHSNLLYLIIVDNLNLVGVILAGRDKVGSQSSNLSYMDMGSIFGMRHVIFDFMYEV